MLTVRGYSQTGKRAKGSLVSHPVKIIVHLHVFGAHEPLMDGYFAFRNKSTRDLSLKGGDNYSVLPLSLDKNFDSLKVTMTYFMTNSDV